MVRQLNLAQRIFVCEYYYKYESARRVRAEFIQNFPHQLPPSRTAIHDIVRKFESTGSVQNKKHERRRTVLTEEKLDEIGANLERSPTKSLPKLAKEVGVSVCSAHKATQLLKLKPYRFTKTHCCLQPDNPAAQDHQYVTDTSRKKKAKELGDDTLLSKKCKIKDSIQDRFLNGNSDNAKLRCMTPGINVSSLNKIDSCEKNGNSSWGFLDETRSPDNSGLVIDTDTECNSNTEEAK